MANIKSIRITKNTLKNKYHNIVQETETCKLYTIIQDKNENYNDLQYSLMVQDKDDVLSIVLSGEDLIKARECFKNSKEIKGKIYNHFKNKKYLTLGYAYNITDKKIYVIYQALYGEFKMYARESSMFFSDKSKKYSDEEYPQKERFKCIGDIFDI